MSSPATHPAVQRDLSLQRLRDLTFASAAAAAGMLGVFSIVAATTLPGHSDGSGTAGNTTTATDPNQSSVSQPAGDDSTADGGQLQPPAQAPVSQPVAAAPHVVSGGSR